MSTVFQNCFEVLAEFVSRWTLPQELHGLLQPVFAGKRMEACKKAEAFKCTASEGLNLYSIVAVFLRKLLLPRGHCLQAGAAFLSLQKLMDLCLEARLPGAVAPEAMERAVHDFLDKCCKAGWKCHMHAKFHWLLHFSAHLRRWRFLPMCFTQERKHRAVKRMASDHLNLRAYDASLLREVLAHDLAHAATCTDFAPRVALLQERPASKKVRAVLQAEADVQGDVRTAHTCRLPRGHCHRGDVVLYQLEGHLRCGRLWLLFQENGRDHAVVQEYHGLHSSDETVDAWRVDGLDGVTILPLRALVQSVAWSADSASACRTIRPFHLRGSPHDVHTRPRRTA